MFLVAGLAVAGLVGIAAAFYFSIRAGHDERDRPGRPGRGGRRSRSGMASPGRTGNTRRAANGSRPANAGRVLDASAADFRAGDDTGPDPVLDSGDPLLAGARNAPGDATRPRRRKGFRKGADVDEELWPMEAFGGVTDEQFWDDLAADKPLATTARAAQQDPGARKGAGPERGTGSYPERRAGAHAGRAPGSYPERGSGSYLGSPAAPDSAADRTLIQPAHVATEPEARGRRRRSSDADDDPLTSAAFSLRPSGPVDGRSQAPRRPRDGEPGWGGSRPGGHGTGSAGGYGGTAPYPYAGRSYGNPSGAARPADTPPYGTRSATTPPHGTPSATPPRGTPASTPPYGESYGYRPPGAAPRAEGQAPRAEGQRRQDGTRGHTAQNGQAASAGNGISRYHDPRQQAYPRDGYQAGGYQGNGYRAPYDPRDDYRRLIPLR